MMSKSIGNIVLKKIIEVPRLEKYIEEIIDYNNIPGEFLGNITLAVTEAAGIILQKERKTDPVVFEFKKEQKKFFVAIRWESVNRDKGYDELDLAIETKSFKRETFIIRSLADYYCLSDDGESLILGFEIGGIALDRSLKRISDLEYYFRKRKKVSTGDER